MLHNLPLLFLPEKLWNKSCLLPYGKGSRTLLLFPFPSEVALKCLNKDICGCMEVED